MKLNLTKSKVQRNRLVLNLSNQIKQDFSFVTSPTERDHFLESQKRTFWIFFLNICRRPIWANSSKPFLHSNVMALQDLPRSSSSSLFNLRKDFFTFFGWRPLLLFSWKRGNFLRESFVKRLLLCFATAAAPLYVVFLSKFAYDDRLRIFASHSKGKKRHLALTKGLYFMHAGRSARDI